MRYVSTVKFNSKDSDEPLEICIGIRRGVILYAHIGWNSVTLQSGLQMFPAFHETVTRPTVNKPEACGHFSGCSKRYLLVLGMQSPGTFGQIYVRLVIFSG